MNLNFRLEAKMFLFRELSPRNKNFVLVGGTVALGYFIYKCESDLNDPPVQLAPYVFVELARIFNYCYWSHDIKIYFEQIFMVLGPLLKFE